MSYILYLRSQGEHITSFPIFHIRLAALFMSEFTLKYVLVAGHARWQNESGHRKKAIAAHLRPKNLPAVRKLLLWYTFSGRKKIEIGKSRTNLSTFQINLRYSTFGVKIIYHAVGGDTKYFHKISTFYLTTSVRC